MKLKTEKTALVNAITAVQGALAKKSTVAVLESVLIRADEGGVSFRATDMELQASANLDAEIIEPGECLVNGDLLANIARRASDTVEFDLEDGLMKVKSGRSRFKLPTLPIGDFPQFRALDEGVSFTLSGDDAERVIRETAFAMEAPGGLQAALQGVYIVGRGERIEAVATNAHILGWSSVACEVEFDGVILPAKAIAQLQGMAKREASIKVTVTPSLVSFEGQWEAFTTKLIDATFPDYERVIPRQNEGLATVDAKELKQAVERATLVADAKVRAVKLSFGDKALCVAASGGDGQSAEDEIAAEFGGEWAANFNAKYVLSAVSPFSSGKVEFLLGEERAPIIVRPEKDERAFVIMLPMKV